MTSVGIRDLQKNAAALVAEAAAGATVTITDRGRPVAQMTAIPASALQQLCVSGRARTARRDIRELPAPAAGPNLSTELGLMRDADR